MKLTLTFLKSMKHFEEFVIFRIFHNLQSENVCIFPKNFLDLLKMNYLEVWESKNL